MNWDREIFPRVVAIVVSGHRYGKWKLLLMTKSYLRYKNDL